MEFQPYRLTQCGTYRFMNSPVGPVNTEIKFNLQQILHPHIIRIQENYYPESMLLTKLIAITLTLPAITIKSASSSRKHVTAALS